MSTVDPRVYTAAAISAINDVLGSAAKAYLHGEVPGDKNNPVEAERIKPVPPIFVLVAVERVSNPTRRADARTAVEGWRLLIQGAGRSVNESNWAMFRVAQALDVKTLPVGPDRTSPLLLETSTAPRYDDDRYVAEAFYKFAH